MALTTIANVRAIPGPLRNVVAVPTAWLNLLIPAADATIKRWVKQEIELACYTQFYDGNEHPELVMQQFPVWSGTTQVATGSNGVALPTATISVETTLNPDGSSMFDPGGRSGQQPTIAVQTGAQTWTVVSYTGTTPTSFTGCTGGTGTMSSAANLNGVSQPVVHVEYAGYSGQAPQTNTGLSPFDASTLQAQGLSWQVEVDKEPNKSYRGLLRRIGGYGTMGFLGSYPNGGYGRRGKLSSYRLSCWPRGFGNVKVQYSAGYQTVPADIQYCATTLVAGMVRNQPKGVELSSEGLGAYSYSILQGSADPDIGNVRRILSRYCEMSW